MSYPCFVAHCRLVTVSMTVTLYMEFSIPVSSLVPVLIRFGILCLHAGKPGYSYLCIHDIYQDLACWLLRCLWCLFFTAGTVMIFKAEKNETAVAHFGVCTPKCQNSAATHKLFRFEPRERRARTDMKHVLTSDECQAAAAAAAASWNKGTADENTQLQWVVIMEPNDW